VDYLVCIVRGAVSFILTSVVYVCCRHLSLIITGDIHDIARDTTRDYTC
jgi:hypothetical protein